MYVLITSAFFLLSIVIGCCIGAMWHKRDMARLNKKLKKG